MTPEAQIAELTEQVFRLSETLRAIAGRASNWNNAGPSEYYRAGQLRAWKDVEALASGGLRWAFGDADEPS
jgi:hypothetical protein